MSRRKTKTTQPSTVVDVVRAQTAQAAALAAIEGQELLSTPHTNPTTRGMRDRLRDEQQERALRAEHARVLRRDRVLDARAAEAEATLEALALARRTLSPARSVRALDLSKRRYLRVSMAASLVLAAGSAMGVEAAAGALGAPTGTGYVAEVGLTVLSTLAIGYRAHLAEHGGQIGTVRKNAQGEGGQWQARVLWALMTVPLLVSVAANVSTGNALGAFCALGAAAFAVLSAVIADRSAAAMTTQAARVDAVAEDELRQVAMGEDLFTTPATTPAPAPVPAAPALETARSEAELIALGADAERVRAYLAARGVQLPVAEISPLLVAESVAHLTPDQHDDARQDGRWLTAEEYSARGLDDAEHGDDQDHNGQDDRGGVDVEELDESTAAIRTVVAQLEMLANKGDDGDALGARVPTPGGRGPQGAANALPGTPPETSPDASSGTVQVIGRGTPSTTQMHPPGRTEPDQDETGRARVAAALAARRSDGDLTRYRVAELLLRLPHTTHATAAEALGVSRDTVKRVRRELREDAGWDQMTTDQREALVAELADRAGVTR